MDLGIAGKAALVVAGSRGLGRATAEALAGEGVRVLLSSRSEAGLDAAAASMRSAGAEVATRVADITDPRTPAHLVEATLEVFGAIDIVIANAGGPPAARAMDLDDAQLEAALNANLLSAIRLTREAVPFMRESGWGRFCYITSYSVVQPVPVLALSNTARTGLWAWVKTAAQDVAAEGRGITMNLLCPGPHATDRMKELGGSGPMGDPADFGSIAAFLCSEQARFVNGAALVVDGASTLAL
jgi:3-oxoacyl-[acyl-carrier protein] reductase